MFFFFSKQILIHEEGCPLYPQQKPGVQIPKPAIQTTNQGLPEHTQELNITGGSDGSGFACRRSDPLSLVARGNSPKVHPRQTWHLWDTQTAIRSRFACSLPQHLSGWHLGKPQSSSLLGSKDNPAGTKRRNAGQPHMRRQTYGCHEGREPCEGPPKVTTDSWLWGFCLKEDEHCRCSFLFPFSRFLLPECRP